MGLRCGWDSTHSRRYEWDSTYSGRCRWNPLTVGLPTYSGALGGLALGGIPPTAAVSHLQRSLWVRRCRWATRAQTSYTCAIYAARTPTHAVREHAPPARSAECSYQHTGNSCQKSGTAAHAANTGKRAASTQGMRQKANGKPDSMEGEHPRVTNTASAQRADAGGQRTYATGQRQQGKPHNGQHASNMTIRRGDPGGRTHLLDGRSGGQQGQYGQRTLRGRQLQHTEGRDER